jgi:hypothetical protein
VGGALVEAREHGSCLGRNVAARVVLADKAPHGGEVSNHIMVTDSTSWTSAPRNRSMWRKPSIAIASISKMTRSRTMRS